MSLYLGSNLISGVATPTEPTRNLGQIVESLVPLTDAGLHLLDGALINGSGIYSAFVTAIAGLVSTYPDLFETEANWQTSVNTYGVCGKFVYTPEVPTYYAWYITANGDGSTLYYTTSTTVSVGDKIYTKSGNSFVEQATLTSGNSGWNVYNSQPRYNSYGTTRKSTADETGSPATVRLPKITGIIEGTTDLTALGDLVEQYVKLPNITGAFQKDQILVQNPALGTGCFRTSALQDYNVGGGNSGNRIYQVNFDASRSSSVYSGDGTDTTIQPQAIKVLYYIVIATTTKTEIEVDIDEITTDLNGKADVDLSNMSASQSAKNTIMSWSMPDYTSAISFTFSPSNSYTAPCNGYISLISNRAQDYISNVKVNGEVITGSLAYWTNVPYIFPVSSGDIVSTDHNSFSGTSTAYLTFNAIFIPMKGAN